MNDETKTTYTTHGSVRGGCGHTNNHNHTGREMTTDPTTETDAERQHTARCVDRIRRATKLPLEDAQASHARRDDLDAAANVYLGLRDAIDLPPWLHASRPLCGLHRKWLSDAETAADLLQLMIIEEVPPLTLRCQKALCMAIASILHTIAQAAKGAK